MCERPILYHEEFHVAAKTHRCCECGRDICPGTKYQRVDGLWAGEWNTFKSCSRCAHVRDEWFHVDPEWVYFGGLSEVIHESGGIPFDTPDICDRRRESPEGWLATGGEKETT